MNNPKHTVAWRVIKKEEWEKLHQDGAHYFASVADDTGNIICQCANKDSLNTAISRAQHIVKCVNSHDEMLEACKEVLVEWQKKVDLMPQIIDSEAIRLVKQAVSKAEGN